MWALARLRRLRRCHRHRSWRSRWRSRLADYLPDEYSASAAAARD